ncbi:hypothetical protein AVEN_220765-1, partial [Araneus ventricosus]
SELIALQEAVKYAQNHQNKVKIWSDSLSRLKALLNKKSNSSIARYIKTHGSLPRNSAKQDLKQRALAKWQRRWDDGINSRSTYEIVKKVGLRNHNWPRQPIFSDSENTRTTAVPVENLARLFTMPPSAASRFLTNSSVQ